MEKFADLVDIAVINLREFGEWSIVSHYTVLQKKIPAEKLAQ